MGIALPGKGTILAIDPRRATLVRQAGRCVVELVQEDLRPRDIICFSPIRILHTFIWPLKMTSNHWIAAQCKRKKMQSGLLLSQV